MIRILVFVMSLLAVYPAYGDMIFPDAIYWDQISPEYITNNSWIKLQPTPQLGAEAEVVYKNTLTVPSKPIESYTLTYNGLAVIVNISYGNGRVSEILEVIPPNGYVAIPSKIDVQDDEIGIVYIYKNQFM